MPFLSDANVPETRDDNNQTLQANSGQQLKGASAGMYGTAEGRDSLPLASDGSNSYTGPATSGSDPPSTGYEFDPVSLDGFYYRDPLSPAYAAQQEAPDLDFSDQRMDSSSWLPECSPNTGYSPSFSLTQTGFSLSFGQLPRFNPESGLHNPNFYQHADPTDLKFHEQGLMWNQDSLRGGKMILHTLPNVARSFNDDPVDSEAIFDMDIDESLLQDFSPAENESPNHRNNHGEVLEISGSPTNGISSTHSSPLSKVPRPIQRRTSSASKDVGRVRKSFSLPKRAKVARVRDIGACPSCRLLKTQCDDVEGPCRNCIIRHKKAALGGKVRILIKDVVHVLPHACADPESDGPKIVQSLVKKILCESHHWHPSLQPDPFFFGSEYRRTGRTEVIRISLGFGPYWVREVEQVVCDTGGYWHSHCKQSWPESHTDPSEHRKVRNPVLPAVFTRSNDLKKELYSQYRMLVQQYWYEFPKYNSPLQILNPIHELYQYHLSGNSEDFSKIYASLLEDALVMLVAVHVAGDLEVDFNDENVQKLMISVPGGYERPDVTCCLLRSQVGVAISELVESLLERILDPVLKLAFDKRCEDFPVVFATFYVIFVTIDSLIYHGAKIPLHEQYHSRLRRNSEQHRLRVPKDIQDGAFRLAEFYSICYPNCHAVHLLRKPDDRPSKSKTHKIPRTEGMTRFLEHIWRAKMKAQLYIDERSEGTRDVTEVTRLLDRLAAQFMMLTVVAPGSK